MHTRERRRHVSTLNNRYIVLTSLPGSGFTLCLKAASHDTAFLECPHTCNISAHLATPVVRRSALYERRLSCAARAFTRRAAWVFL